MPTVRVLAVVRALLPAALAALVSISPRPAHASDGETALSVFAGYATYTAPRLDPEDDEDPSIRPTGGVLGFDYERGFSRSLAWRVSGGGGLYSGEGLAYDGHATVGLTYLLDILKYVPYANVGVGGIVTGGARQDLRVAPLVELGGGVDFLRSREFSWGVQVRFETLLQSTLLVTAGVRASWRWGFF